MIEKQSAYVLHSRSYRETSAMVDFFTPDFGLIRCIGRGIKKQLSKGQGLQPFVQYQIQFTGQSDLKKLNHFEPTALPLSLQGEALFSGFYVNEVILRALRSEADIEAEQLFSAYEDALHSLSGDNLEVTLRRFELTLLEHMGQSYDWAFDFKLGIQVDETAYYGFFPEQGMSRVGVQYVNKSPNRCYLGEDLIALSKLDLSSFSTRKMSKRLLRAALQPIIGYKPLQARELLKQYRSIGRRF